MNLRLQQEAIRDARFVSEATCHASHSAVKLAQIIGTVVTAIPSSATQAKIARVACESCDVGLGV